MPNSLLQASFTAGELAPVLHGRVDLQKYQTGAALLKNWIPMQYGGITNRPGLEHVIFAKSRSSKSRLIPFQAENGDAFVIELADQKIRFIRNGGIITTSIGSIDAVTNGDPLVISTTAGHSLSSGDLIAISECEGMTELNGGVFRVYVDTAFDFRVAHPVTLQAIDGSDFGTYTSGGLVFEVYEISSPWTSDELAEIDYAQSVDLVVLVHPDHPPQYLRRVADDSWTLTAMTMDRGPFQEVNAVAASTLSTGAGLAEGATGTISSTSLSASDVGKYIYIEAVDRKGAWQSGVNLATGYFYISNGSHFYVNVNNATTGARGPTHDKGTQWDGMETSPASSVQWEYLHSGWGVAHIDDENGLPNVYDVTAATRLPADTGTWRWALQEFDDTRGYPRAVCFYQQRLFFGGNAASPESVWASRTGDYSDFIRTTIVTDDAPLKFSSASRKLNRVRFLDGINSLICLTSSSESVVSGPDGVISPSSLSIRPQSYLGCAGVKPLLIGNRMLFVQDKARILRDMAFSLEADSFVGDDLTLLANHLFSGKSIAAIAYAQHPYSLVWVALDDGSLLSLTYYREQDVIAWARHETDGEVEDVVVVSEDGEDAVYLLVNRDGFDNGIFGTNRRFIERMSSRSITGIDEAFFVDAGLAYDGNNTGTDYCSLTTAGGWTPDDTVTVTRVGTGAFESNLVGESFVFRLGSDEVEIVITAVVASDELEGNPTKDVPEPMREIGATSTDWAIARKTFRLVLHLSGREVTALADGNVVGPYTVDEDGLLVLDNAASRVVVGLAYESLMQTLPLNVLGGESTQPRQKIVNNVNVICEDTRGIEAGPDTDHPTEFRAPLRDRYSAPLSLKTGIWDTAIRTDWKQQAQVVIRQGNPLPATILAIIPEVTLGG